MIIPVHLFTITVKHAVLMDAVDTVVYSIGYEPVNRYRMAI